MKGVPCLLNLNERAAGNVNGMKTMHLANCRVILSKSVAYTVKTMVSGGKPFERIYRGTGSGHSKLHHRL